MYVKCKSTIHSVYICYINGTIILHVQIGRNAFRPVDSAASYKPIHFKTERREKKSSYLKDLRPMSFLFPVGKGSWDFFHLIFRTFYVGLPQVRRTCPLPKYAASAISSYANNMLFRHENLPSYLPKKTSLFCFLWCNMVLSLVFWLRPPKTEKTGKEISYITGKR